ncbi:MAG: 6-bladed beta-propeller [bacterium]
MDFIPNRIAGRILHLAVVSTVCLLAVVFSPSPSLTQVNAEGVKASYLYGLSDFTGSLPYTWPKIGLDETRNETYVIYGDIVRMFDENGMEVYRFGEDLGLGPISDLAVLGDGNILLLINRLESYELVLCDFRGTPASKIKIENLPPAFSGMVPNRLCFRQGRLYFVDLGTKKVVVTDSKGIFQDGYDLAALADFEEKKAGVQNDIVGFSVDSKGNMLFTVPTLFRAFRLSPDKTLASFGSSGSIPGKFNVIAGIASDDQGRIYVADSLRSVVAVFDKDFKFLAELSSRGFKPGELIVPKEVAVDNKGRIYISQAAQRGVSVFQIFDN